MAERRLRGSWNVLRVRGCVRNVEAMGGDVVWWLPW